MGLDMFLSGKIYLSPRDKNNKKIKELFKEINEIGNSDYVIVELGVGYWRKANAIHNWFVKNIQNGNDDCKEYWVKREKLKELKELCNKVLKDKNKAPELLPTISGFFFGNLEYDGYYFHYLEDTVKIIDKILKLSDNWNIYYNSSW